MECRLQNDNLVIGCTLESLLFSYAKGYPFIFYKPCIPEICENLKIEDLGTLELYPSKKFIRTYDSKTKTTFVENLGVSKYDLFQKLYFLCSLRGLNPFGESIRKILKLSGKRLEIFSNNRPKVIISYEKIYAFDPYELNNIRCKNYHYQVFDTFEIESRLITRLSKILKYNNEICYLLHSDDVSYKKKWIVKEYKSSKTEILMDYNELFNHKMALERFIKSEEIWREDKQGKRGWQEFKLGRGTRHLKSVWNPLEESNGDFIVDKRTVKEIIDEEKIPHWSEIFYKIFSLENKKEIERGFWKERSGWTTPRGYNPIGPILR